MYDVVPSNLVMKRVSPRWWLAGLTTVWGVIAMSLGFVRNYVSRPLVLLLHPISSVSSVFSGETKNNLKLTWIFATANRPT